MPLVKLAMLVASGVALLGSRLVENNAEEKERRAADIFKEAAGRHEQLTAEHKSLLDRFLSDIKDEKDFIQISYEEAKARTARVFSKYGHPIGDIHSWPMPPGFEKFAQMKIPDFPTSLTYEGKAAFERAMNSKRTEIMASEGLKQILTGTGNGWQIMGAGASRLVSAAERNSAATKFLTDAVNEATRVTRFAEEIEGFKTVTFPKARAIARTLAEAMEGMHPWIIKYCTKGEAYIRAGKTRQTLTDEEYRDIINLALVMATMADVARKPLI